MPIKLINTTCKDHFEFDSQKDATYNACLAAMDNLLSTRRKSTMLCDKPGDSKWSNNRDENIRLRYHAVTKHMKENPVAELSIDSVHHSVRNSTKCKVMNSDDSKEEEMMDSLSSIYSSEVMFTSCFEEEVEDGYQKQLELSCNDNSFNGQKYEDELNNECEDNISKACITGDNNNLIINCNKERQENHIPITINKKNQRNHPHHHMLHHLRLNIIIMRSYQRRN